MISLNFFNKYDLELELAIGHHVKTKYAMLAFWIYTNGCMMHALNYPVLSQKTIRIFEL